MLNRYFMAAALGLALTSCDSTIEDATSKRPKTNVSHSEEDGVVTADAKADSDNTIVASSDSDSAGSYVDIPAGALAVDTDLLMGDGKDKSADILNKLGVSTSTNAIVSKSAPMVVQGADDVELAKPFTVALPIPQQDGFTLTASGKLVFIYVVFTSEGLKAGIKALTAENLAGVFVKSEFEGLGYFQIAYFADEVEDQEVTYDTRPELE
ncbi:MAG: hypothetical protein AB7T49_10090 [Oligoflexales bacterium]